MNRRSFISKALAAVAAVPLLSRVVKGKPARTYPYTERIVWPDRSGNYHHAVESLEPVIHLPLDDSPLVWGALFTIDEHGRLIELSGKGYERVPVPLAKLGRIDIPFPRALEDWPQVTHFSWGKTEEEIMLNRTELYRSFYCAIDSTATVTIS